MIKRFFILLYCLGNITFLCSAQQALPQQISLEQARKIALKNNPDLQVKSIQASIAQKEVEEAKWQKIPDIYAHFNARRNLIIPTTPVPAIAFDPNAKEGEIKPLKFQTDWTSNAGINAEITIFNPESHGKVAEQQQKAAMKETEKEITANDLRFQIGKDYTAVIIAKKQLSLARADTVSKDKILTMTRAQYHAGRIKRVDLNQIISEKNQSLSNYLKAVKILASARTQFITDLGISPDDTLPHFTLSDSLTKLLSNPPTIDNKKDSNGLALKKWKQQKDLTILQIRHTRQGFLPTISLKGFYGSNYFDNDFHFFDGNHWYGNSYIGLSVDVPITRGLDRVKKTEALQLQYKANQANYRSQRNQRQQAITQAKQEVDYRNKDLLMKKKEWRISRRNAQNTQQKLLHGRLLIGDLSKSNLQYQQAKTNYLQAAYDCIIAKMKLEKVRR